MVEPKRPKKQCVLTQIGSKRLKEAIAKLEAEEQSDFALGLRCGCDRSTVSKIRTCSGSVAWSSINKLFTNLNLDLAEQDWEKWQSQAGQSLVRKTRNGKAQQPLQPGLISREQQVADLLWTLDCSDQEGDFNRVLDPTVKFQCFLLKANDLKVQKWLVKRLIRSHQNAGKYPFAVRSHPMRWDFNAFWQDFAEQLKLAKASPNEVLRCLCELATTKPIFIAVYGVDGLEEFKRKLLEDFWMPLCERYCSQTGNSFRSKLFLFLTESIRENSVSNQESKLNPICPLIKIQSRDVVTWMACDDVYEALCNCLEASCVEALVQNDVPLWNTQPAEVLDEVCFAFQLKGGIAEIERYWELAG